MLTEKLRRKIKDRSESKCEAMVVTPRGIYPRCWRQPIEIHHLLTRARGGNILDAQEETYHLIALCNEHHAMSDGGDAYAGGLLIDGYVTTGKYGQPTYHGSDDELTARYPPDD